ncbi:DUF349 domain-containing protein [Kocuria rosea]|uniref:DUF349 domain-containing protein n=1 Tax=Kocuria rosea TaxID=1275 RepID=UPI0039C234FF
MGRTIVRSRATTRGTLPGSAPGESERVPAVTERLESDDQPTPRPVPAPGPVPKPGVPRPGAPAAPAQASPGPAPTPAAVPPSAAPAATPSVTPGAAPSAAAPALASPESVARARAFGRVTEDGHVYVVVDGEEVLCGQFPDATEDEALGYFARKFDDVEAQVALLEQRVAAGAPSADMQSTVDHLAEQVGQRKMLGDVKALESRLEALRPAIRELEAAERAAHEAQRAQNVAAREAIVAEAEQIAAQDPQRTQWKQSSARMAELFDQWKTHQKSGIRLGRAAEDALWKRFRTARTTFDRHRRAFFSQLDADNSEAKKAKEALIAEAEALSGSTDWGATAAEYRRLMDRWKESKRASKKDDDALWARFRAAQDTFFAARKADNDRIDEEFEGNLAVKEQLLAEAKALLPITDLKAAKRALGDILDRWEQAGKVPRAHMRRVEAELRTVEDAVRQVEDEKWQRSNPETKARSNSMLTQLESKIEDQEDALARAQATGDTKRAAKLEGELATSRQWLETLRRSAADLR